MPPQEFLKLNLEVRASRQKAAVKRATEKHAAEEDRQEKDDITSSAALKKLSNSLADHISRTVMDLEARLEGKIESVRKPKV